MNKKRVKKFFSYYKPYRGLLAADILCALAVAAISLVLPLLIRYITKDILEEPVIPVAAIFQTGLLMACLICVQVACMFFYDYKGHAMGAMMENDMRIELFQHFQRLPMDFFNANRVGSMMARITNDLLSLTELYHHGPEDLTVYLVKFIGAFVILLTVNARLTWVAFALLPVMIVFTLLINKKLSVVFKDNLQRIADVNDQVEDNLSGIRVVKSFTNEPLEEEKFSAASRRFLKSRLTIYKTEAVFTGGISLLSQFITVLVVVFGAALVSRETLDLADLITFLLYVGFLVEPIPKLAFVINQYQEGIAGFQRCMDVMDLAPEAQDDGEGLPAEPIFGDVTFNNVGFTYQGERDCVLKNLSFEVKRGEYVALVGSSGVGKTTLGALLARFYRVSEGEILLDGHNINDLNLTQLRRSIGVVWQDVFLFSGTVMENILYGCPDATPEEVVEAAKMAGAHTFISALGQGYDTDIGPHGVKLSGGQKQRLSVARAFLKNPRILVFDEATSALDNESEQVVKESMERLSRGRTTFVIAHRLSTIRDAGRILVLTDQGIVEQGTHGELLALNGVYAKLVRAQ